MAKRSWIVTVVLGSALGALTMAQPETPAPPEKQELPRAAAAEPIPEEAKRIKNPVPATRDSIARGERIFSGQCTMCHGALGDGTGPLVARLKLSVPDFTDAEQQQRWSDGQMYYVIKNGHGRMPAQGDRFEDNTWWDTVNYIRSLSSGR